MKLDENPSRPNGAWPGVIKSTFSATNVSRRARSPALTASIQIECTVRISRSSDAIACLGLTRPQDQRPRNLKRDQRKERGGWRHAEGRSYACSRFAASL